MLVAEGSVLADAFAALLAAEQDSASPGSGAAGGRATSRRYTLPDEVVSDLVERVAGHLTDTYIRDRATGIVSEVAERLVHDEIAPHPGQRHLIARRRAAAPIRRRSAGLLIRSHQHA